jgi:hypothetical protein
LQFSANPPHRLQGTHDFGAFAAVFRRPERPVCLHQVAVGDGFAPSRQNEARKPARVPGLSRRKHDGFGSQHVRQKDVAHVGRCHCCHGLANNANKGPVAICAAVRRLDQVKNKRDSPPKSRPFPERGFAAIRGVRQALQRLGQVKHLQAVRVRVRM